MLDERLSFSEGETEIQDKERVLAVSSAREQRRSNTKKRRHVMKTASVCQEHRIMHFIYKYVSGAQ
jgi:hypothetical protein